MKETYCNCSYCSQVINPSLGCYLRFKVYVTMWSEECFKEMNQVETCSNASTGNSGSAGSTKLQINMIIKEVHDYHISCKTQLAQM